MVSTKDLNWPPPVLFSPMEGSTGGSQGTDVGGLLTAGALRIKGSITFIDPEVGRVRERVWGKG